MGALVLHPTGQLVGGCGPDQERLGLFREGGGGGAGVAPPLPAGRGSSCCAKGRNQGIWKKVFENLCTWLTRRHRGGTLQVDVYMERGVLRRCPVRVPLKGRLRDAGTTKPAWKAPRASSVAPANEGGGEVVHGVAKKAVIPTPPPPPSCFRPRTVFFSSRRGTRLGGGGPPARPSVCYLGGLSPPTFSHENLVSWPGEAPPRGAPSPLDPPPPPPPPPPTRRRLAQPTPCSRPPPPPGPASPLLHWRRRRPRSAHTGMHDFMATGLPQERNVDT